MVDPSETEAEPDACVLLKLNARVPMTTIPVGTRFADVAGRFAEGGPLITAPSPEARGAVPYNVCLLAWGASVSR